MKSLTAIAAAIVLTLSLSACASPSPSDQSPTPSPSPSPAQTESPSPSPTTPDTAASGLKDVIELIYKDVKELPMTSNTEITAENFAYYLFIDPIEGAEGISSDAMIGSIAYSVCLLNLPDGSDGDKIAADIEKNADPRKWICVEAEKTIVSRRGNLILLVMADAQTADAIAANFDALG